MCGKDSTSSNRQASARRDQHGAAGGSVGAEGSKGSCDGSTTAPNLNIEDFTCFIKASAAATHLPPFSSRPATPTAQSTRTGVLNVEDFT
jgi:hypothetical protein